MSDEDFRALVADEIRSALSYIDSEISPARTLNYEYFMGTMSDVPAIEGRSTVVVRVVADYIGFILPSLLRTMISGRKVIEYIAKGQQDEDAAKIATDFVNDIVLRSDNHIEQEAYGWGFDGLVNKVGVLKVWWEEQKDVEDFTLPPMDELQFVMAVLQAEQQGVEIVGHAVDAMGMHNLQLRRTTEKSHVKIGVLPPEEFVVSADARSLETSRLKSHRTFRYVGDLIKQGYDPDKVMALPSYTSSESSPEFQARQTVTTMGTLAPGNDPMLRKVAVHEGTILCNKDGSGLREWYFVAGGWEGNVQILEAKEFEDEVYFCDFCPIPLPHLFFGRCPADDLIEIQRVQTVLSRQTMDNLYLTNAPQQEVLVSQIVGQRIEYVQNKSPGGIIPVTALGTVNNITVPFMAKESLGLMQYWDMQAENRTGAGRSNAGLEPDRLQNQSATAAMLQDSAAKLKMETIARVWATGGMRKLGRAILRVMKRRQDFGRMVRLNGGEKQVDPRAWAELEDWDVTVNTGLGTGDKAKTIQALGLIIAKQEQVVQTLGPNNPICNLAMLSQSYQDLAEAVGEPNPAKRFNALPPNMQTPEPKPPEDPKITAAKINAQAKAITNQADNAVKVHKTEADNDLDYFLGLREQDLEVFLTMWKERNRATGADTNVAKVAGQRTH